MSGVELAYDAYEKTDFLNRLLWKIPLREHNIAKVVLRPSVEEILKLIDKRYTYSTQTAEGQIERRRDDFRLFALCRENHISPFWNLTFDYTCLNPRIVYDGYDNNSGSEFSHNPRKFSDPLNFVLGKKWFGIVFENKQASVAQTPKIKEAVFAHTEGDSYIVTELQIQRNPRRDGESIRAEASLYASRGKVKILGRNVDELEELVRSIEGE